MEVRKSASVESLWSPNSSRLRSVSEMVAMGTMW